MIKVLKENPVSRAQIKCSNCKSLLEYGNDDLNLMPEYVNNNDVYTTEYHNYGFYCPVCGCKVFASWIHKEEQQ